MSKELITDNEYLEKVRKHFEAWASTNHLTLTRHPIDNDFYYNKDVSMLWVCFAEGFAVGCDDQLNTIQKEFTEYALPTAQEVLIERALEDD
jgi:hypothetical protein